MTSAVNSFTDPCTVVAFTVWILMLLLHCNDNDEVLRRFILKDDDNDCLSSIIRNAEEVEMDSTSLFCCTLNNFRLATSCLLFTEELGYWIKPRSTTWFSKFLLLEYKDSRWIQMFQMSKKAVFSLADLFSPHVARQNTNYRLSISVLIRVCCTLFKLAYGANLTICNEMFAIGRSIVSKILRDVVRAVNDTLRHKLVWPIGAKMRDIQMKFSALCGLPIVVGAIDGTQISISKPAFGASDYFYFKSGQYSMNYQVVVDSDKWFVDLYVGMRGSTNNSRMLRQSSLFHMASQGSLFDFQYSVEGQTLYLISDLGYSLLPWLMIPHRGCGALSISKAIFNKKLRCGRCVVENAFSILKQTFRELLEKSNLHVTFLPDVVFYCAILHNLLLGQFYEEVEEFFIVLCTEGYEGEVLDAEFNAPKDIAIDASGSAMPKAYLKREQLGLYMSTRRKLHVQE